MRINQQHNKPGTQTLQYLRKILDNDIYEYVPNENRKKIITLRSGYKLVS